MDTPIDRRRSRNMKTHFCIPRMRGRITRKSTRISPLSLLQRFREAVFRLIMISALSKTTTPHENRTSSQSSPAVHQYYRSYDPQYHSEAVADCIEFIKKSSITDENREYSISSNGSSSCVMDDDSTEVVIPLPVM